MKTLSSAQTPPQNRLETIAPSGLEAIIKTMTADPEKLTDLLLKALMEGRIRVSDDGKQFVGTEFKMTTEPAPNQIEARASQAQTTSITKDGALPSRPEVAAIATALNLSRDEVVGRLLAVWGWADRQTTDGLIPVCLLEDIDAAAEMPGFGDAMAAVGWVEVIPSSLRFPKVNLRNGTTAQTCASQPNN